MYSWQKISKEDFEPDYFDHGPDSDIFSTAIFPGRIVIRGDDVSYEPDRRSLAILKWFAICFTITLMVGMYFLASDEIRWAVVAAIPAFAALTFGLWYFLLNREIDAGPYVVYSAATNEIVLPKYSKRFAKELVYLQEVTGRCKDDPEIETHLNLVAIEGDVKRRYHVKSGPFRKIVKQFAKHAEVPVVELNLGWFVYGNQDLAELAETSKIVEHPSHN